jgi:hypothetical protein
MAEFYSTSHLTSNQVGNAIDQIVNDSKAARRNFEKRWYDNNFFDDGYHFRYLSRQENKIIDLADKATLYSPLRAIPKASRQIRGIANLLLATDPVPVVYPENVSSSQYPPVIDQQTGQKTTNPELLEAREAAKDIARKSGHWLMEEFKNQDLTEKLAQMVILAAKHGISFIQIWPDAVNEKIKTQVFDAFDIFISGTVTELEDSPYLIKAKPRTVAEIKADERFDKEKTAKISPDNRYANSEIKDAYMRARYGGSSRPDSAATVMEKESFIKEYLNEENEFRIKLQPNGGEILKNRNKGDVVIRHTFVEGNIEVLDEYLELTDYPFVDFRMEPGPMYGVPLIERFIPANKSLDIISSRIERFTNVMLTGMWTKRKGENFEISNSSNGQVVEYQNTKPEQMQVTGIPGSYFEILHELQSYIEEQGVSVTTMGKLPKGVKANAAIESLKESEYANLVIPTRRLKASVKRIAEKFLDLGDGYFVTPQNVQRLEKGEPSYFDVIGKSGLAKRQAAKLKTSPDVIPLSGDYHVDIQVEDQLAYTAEGKKAAAKELMNMFIELAPLGLISPEVVKVFVQQVLEKYGWGDTQEIIEAMEDALAQGNMTQPQMGAMKASMGQVLNDFQKAGVFPSDQQRIMENKIGVAQTAVDLNKNGIPDNQEGGQGG